MVHTKKRQPYRSQMQPNPVFLRFFRGLPPAGRMLDLGCNTGPEVRYAGMHGWTVDACDVDAEAIAELNAFLMANRVTNVYAARCSLQEYLLTTEHRYDLVQCWNVMHQLRRPDVGLVLAGIHEVLKPGGAIILQVFNEEERAFWGGEQKRHCLFRVGEVLEHFPDYKVLEHFAGIIQDPGSPNRPEPHEHAVEHVVLRKP